MTDVIIRYLDGSEETFPGATYTIHNDDILITQGQAQVILSRDRIRHISEIDPDSALPSSSTGTDKTALPGQEP